MKRFVSACVLLVSVPAIIAARSTVAADPAANPAGLLEGRNEAARAESTPATPRGQSARDVLPEGGVIIIAPEEPYSWRVWSGGKIEFSFDSSRTWEVQKSGVTTDLTGGSATSGKVCWVIGRAGTILLTTDRGKHWKKLASPIKEDVAGVYAQDAKRASIWTASHKQSFETNDGGVTWISNSEK